MKWLLFLLIVILTPAASAQKKTLCVVVAINGEVHTPDKNPLKPGDRIIYENIQKLVPRHLGSFITLLYPDSGTFRVRYSTNGPVMEFTKELLKLKAKSVSLSSRGECECAVLADCLFSDPLINDHVLIWDTLSFPVDQALSYYDSGFYFLQTKYHDRIFNKRLKTQKNKVLLTPSDLEINGSYSDSSEQTFTLGLYKEVEGKKFHEIITRLKFTRVTPSFLDEYYHGLQVAMKGQPPEDIYNTFYTDLYIWYGKPDDCRLKQLIGFKTQ